MMCARLFTKGAAEQILELCTRRIRDDSGVALLGPEEKQHLLDSFSHDGNRCACCFILPLVSLVLLHTLAVLTVVVVTGWPSC